MNNTNYFIILAGFILIFNLSWAYKRDNDYWLTWISIIFCIGAVDLVIRIIDVINSIVSIKIIWE